MTYKRFLRDGIFDRLIQELSEVIRRIPQDEENTNFLFSYLNSVLITYKTCKITLERIEEAIEMARPMDSTGEIFAPLCEAATHIKSGVLSLHEDVWRTLEPFREEMNIAFNEFEDLVRVNYLNSL